MIVCIFLSLNVTTDIFKAKSSQPSEMHIPKTLAEP